MKVLQLCSKIPYPAKDGGCLAMLNLADMLYNSGFQVKILAMETHKHPIPTNGYPKDFIDKFNIESVSIETKANLLKALSNLIFDHQSYHLARFKQKSYAEKLIAILKIYKPDFVIIDSLFSGGYIDEIRANSKAKIIYRAHNIEYVIWHEIALKTKSFIKKTYLNLQSKRLKIEEHQIISNCDALLAITNKDADFFILHFSKKQLMTLPFTIDLNQYNLLNKVKDKALFFIGAMDWYPNLEGVKWFIDKVWNEVLAQHPKALFYIAGKAMPLELKNLEYKNIINLGEVPDAKEFIGNYPIMIAPIFSGGGLKIKIIEAMAMGKIVICNPQAASGIPVNHNKNILLANSSKEFITLIVECFNDLQKHSFIGENARLLIEEHFNTSIKREELSSFIKSIN